MATGKILLLGRGYLAEQYASHFGEQAVWSAIDITDREQVERAIDEQRPDTIINLAAKTNTAALERPENQPEGYRVNVGGPANLLLAAERHGLRLVHVSSGMVFADGERREGDPMDPRSYYAWTKAWADLQLEPFLAASNSLILRIQLPISGLDHPKNLLAKMRAFSGGLNAQSSFTLVPGLLQVTERLLQDDQRGTFHVANPGSISFYEILQVMQAHGAIPAERELQAISKADFDRSAMERGGAYQPAVILNTDKLQAAGVILPDVKAAVLDAITTLTTQS